MTSQSAPRGLVGAPVYNVLVVDVLVSVVVKALILPGRVAVVTTPGTVVRVVVVFVFVVIVVLSMKHSFKQSIVASMPYLSASMHAFASSSGQSWHLHTSSVMYSTNPSRPWQQSTLVEVSVRVVVVRVLVVVLRPRRVVNVVVVLVAVFVVPVAVVLAAVLGGGDGGVSGGRGPGGGGVGAGPPPGAAGADLVLGKFQLPPYVE